MKEKNMFEEKMTNCPRCRKPILNGGVFTSPAKFTMRCPWCQVTLAVTVMPKIITEVIGVEHDENFEQDERKHQQEKTYAKTESQSHASSPGNKEQVAVADNNQGFKVVGYMYPADSK